MNRRNPDKILLMVTRVKEKITANPKIESIDSGVEVDSIEKSTEQPVVEETNAEKGVENPSTQMYLLSALTQNPSSALTELTALILSAGFKVEKSEDLGLKKLAFPINKHLELSLVSVFFRANNQIIKTLDGELKHTDTIERYLLTTWRASLEDTKRRIAERQKREVKQDV